MRAIDLFSGVGGMELGFQSVGVETVAAFDFDRLVIPVHQRNFPETKAIQLDLSEASADDIRRLSGLDKVDLVYGGPPCQGFSMIGRRDPEDQRRDLLVKAAQLTVDLQPDYFVFENVPGVLSGNALEVVSEFLRVLEKGGYVTIQPTLLKAEEYGVPQLRRRVFFVGCRKELVIPHFPAATRRYTVWEAIGDLPDVGDDDETLRPFGEPSDYVNELNSCFPMNVEELHKTGFAKTVHSPEVIARFDALGFGEKDKVSHASRLDPNGFSRTILASTGPEHGSHTGVRPIHPYLPRYISIREVARIQSFPDWFRFSPAKFNALRQIGNAVPPLLARAVGLRVIQAFDSRLPPGG